MAKAGTKGSLAVIFLLLLVVLGGSAASSGKEPTKSRFWIISLFHHMDRCYPLIRQATLRRLSGMYTPRGSSGNRSKRQRDTNCCWCRMTEFWA